MTVGLIPEREAKALQLLAEGKDPLTAMREAGYTLNDSNAQVLAKEIWRRNMNANESMVAALTQVGISPLVVANKMKEQLDATTTLVTKAGLIEVPDNKARHNALDMVHKVAGTYAPKVAVAAAFRFEDALEELAGED